VIKTESTCVQISVKSVPSENVGQPIPLLQEVVVNKAKPANNNVGFFKLDFFILIMIYFMS